MAPSTQPPPASRPGCGRAAWSATRPRFLCTPPGGGWGRPWPRARACAPGWTSCSATARNGCPAGRSSPTCGAIPSWSAASTPAAASAPRGSTRRDSPTTSARTCPRRTGCGISAGPGRPSSSRLPGAARELDDAAPGQAVQMLAELAGGVAGLRVAVLGAAYRAGVKETAFSGVFAVVRELARRGAAALVHDPLYHDDELRRLRLPPYRLGEACDAVIVHTDHPEYRALVPGDLPGVRALVDGRAITDPEGWGAIPRRVIGAAAPAGPARRAGRLADGGRPSGPRQPAGLGRVAREVELAGQRGPAQDAGELAGLRTLARPLGLDGREYRADAGQQPGQRRRRLAAGSEQSLAGD